MKMIGQNRPSVTTNAGFGEQSGDAIHKILPIDIVNKDIATLNSANDYVLEKPGNVKSG